VALSRVVSYAEKLCVDLTVVESNWFFSRFLGDNGFFVSPRLDFVLDITESLEFIQKRIDEGKLRRLRQVAEAGYTFEVTRDLAKLDAFYNELYLPHMLKRHVGCALPISLSECRELFSKGELLLIKSSDELVSGNLLVPHNCELHSPVVGVSDIEEHLTLGSYAAYYFSILLGIERGFVRMDFGEAPPFMSDGLFQFKRGLGMWVRAARGDSAQVFGVRFSGLGESVRRFLSVNSFVFVDGEGLSGVVFLERVDASSVKPFCVPGLSSLYIISPEVHRSNNLKIEQLTLAHCSLYSTPATILLNKLDDEGKYSLFRITW